MNTSFNYTDSIVNGTKNDSDYIVFIYSSTSSSTDSISTIILISILSVLCLLGVIFMIFGPILRSEAWKHVDNYIFGQSLDDEAACDDQAESADEDL